LSVPRQYLLHVKKFKASQYPSTQREHNSTPVFLEQIEQLGIPSGDNAAHRIHNVVALYSLASQVAKHDFLSTEMYFPGQPALQLFPSIYALESSKNNIFNLNFI